MWVPALAGCAAVAGYAVTRPLSAAARVGALLDVAALLGTALLVASLLPQRLPARLRHVAAPLLVGLLLATRSVRDAVLVGALIPCAVALVLYALSAPRRWRSDGLALGAAIAVAPVYALFAILPWRSGRRATAVVGVTVGSAVTALRFGAGGGPWLPVLSGQRPAGGAARLDDISVRGMLLRLGVHGSAQLACWLAALGVVGGAAAVRAQRYVRDAQPLLAVSVLGCFPGSGPVGGDRDGRGGGVHGCLRRCGAAGYAARAVAACCMAVSAGAAADLEARSGPERNSVPQITAPAPKMPAATQNPVV
jgi:hypothetical protein